MNASRRVAGAFLAAMALLAASAAAQAASSKARQTERQRQAAGRPSVPRSGSPAGPLQIMVSLSQQRLTVFDRGLPIMSSAISSGQSGYDTPAGIYTILQKNRHHESNIYSGAPMPYMQRITWSGIALHEGNLPGYPASHGCIRLPGAFAGTLFGVTNVGARVIVAREPLVPQPFEHDKLFKPEPPAQQPMASQSVVQERAGGAATVSGNTGFLVSSAAADSGPMLAVSSDRPTIPEMPVTATRSDRDKAKSNTDSIVSVLVSRKTGRIYIRQNFEPLHEAPIDITDADLPLGTHVFTATAFNNDKSRLVWNVVSYESESGQKIAQAVPRGRLTDADRADAVAGVTRRWSTPPAAALERVVFDAEIADILSEVARPGMSLIVTDHGPGPETGKGTEFVIQPGR